MIFCITQTTEILLCFAYFTALTSKQNPRIKKILNPGVFKEQIFSIDILQLCGSQSEGNSQVCTSFLLQNLVYSI